jgi:hypothetical protein
MAICASCGRPVDTVTPGHGACPSCTWRAAIRVSQAAVEERSADVDLTFDVDPESSDDIAIAASDDPSSLMERLCDLTASAGEPLDSHRANRVYEALVRGNLRPYRAELNRLTARFIERLEEGWH